MRTNCSRRQAPNPLLLSSEDAVAALRWSVGPRAGDALCVLLCAEGPLVVNAVVVDDVSSPRLPKLIDVVLEAVAGTDVEALVVGVLRGGSAVPTLDDLDAAADAVQACRDAGVQLVDVLLVGARGWRSLGELAWP
jgi:hypothetical protein